MAFLGVTARTHPGPQLLLRYRDFGPDPFVRTTAPPPARWRGPRRGFWRRFWTRIRDAFGRRG